MSQIVSEGEELISTEPTDEEKEKYLPQKAPDESCLSMICFMMCCCCECT